MVWPLFTEASEMQAGAKVEEANSVALVGTRGRFRVRLRDGGVSRRSRSTPWPALRADGARVHRQLLSAAEVQRVVEQELKHLGWQHGIALQI